jgi:hypothetical protein
MEGSGHAILAFEVGELETEGLKEGGPWPLGAAC